ncbi:MAG: class I SAM-dependent methyltransferase [Actinomycetota bacterium]
MDRTEHWETLYTTRDDTRVGWFEPVPTVSLRRIREAVEAGARSLIDVGGGSSRLVDHVLELGLDRVAVLDVAEHGLEIARKRLGERGRAVEWIVADVTEVDDVGRFDIWHDRAVFHFLTSDEERARYVALAERTVRPGGFAVMATFAADGPEQCSGLPVCRYDPAELARQCGPNFELLDSERYVHTTPRGVEQRFAYSTFRRLAPDRELVGAS